MQVYSLDSPELQPRSF